VPKRINYANPDKQKQVPAKKSEPVPAPVKTVEKITEDMEARQMAMKAEARAEAAERTAKEVGHIASQQAQQLQELIAKFPAPEGAPKIVGFEIQRDQSGFAKSIVFKRESRTLN
jgi:hypothetical protein